MSINDMRWADARLGMPASGFPRTGRVATSAFAAGSGIAALAGTAPTYKPQHVDVRNAALGGVSAWSPPV